MAVGRCCAPGSAANAPGVAAGRRVAGMKLPRCAKVRRLGLDVCYSRSKKDGGD